MYSWLEGWSLGYDRNDASTRQAAKLPYTHQAGIFARYGIAHEQFVWDLKSEPALIDKFAQIWGTDELLVSYGKYSFSQSFHGITQPAMYTISSTTHLQVQSPRDQTPDIIIDAR